MILRPKLWLGISIATMVLCVIIIAVSPPLIGIDFKGGTLIEVKTETLSSDALTTLVSTTVGKTATAQSTATHTFLLRTESLDTAAHETLSSAFKEADPALEELRFETVGPTIGAQLRRKAWLAMSLSVLVTILYLAYEFRHTGGLVSSWKFGVSAAVALVHDLLVVTAGFAILGRTLGAPVDALFVTAMLALAGYSVNDTIVLFNRLKQEWLATRSGTLLSLIDRAIKLTLVRSLNTSIPILLTLLTLLFFGGTSIRWFIVALTIGTITGTYSTIFVAPAFLHLLAKR